jgi:hypothetical protein
MNLGRSGSSLILLVSFSAGCDDTLKEPALVNIDAGHHPQSGPDAQGGVDAGKKAHVVPPHDCTAECCPVSSECYVNGPSGAGAECMAQRDNATAAGGKRWQFRQTMSISAKPVGNVGAPIGTVLLLRSELPGWSVCNEGTGQGGFIQLVDFDLVANTARVGFATYVKPTDVETVRQQGLCFASGTYNDAKWGLPADQMSPMGAGWPKGLPPPMALGSAPWQFGPTKAFRLDKDFKLAADRAAILARFADGGDLAGKYTGVFYLDQTTGFTHGYAPVTYIVTYDSATAYNAIPIREAELTAQLNDPASPDCVGVYGQYITKAGSCQGTTDKPAWGCPGGECPEGQAPNVTHGYFLITEMEQVYNSTLQTTLCVAYPGGSNTQAAGWTGDGHSCRTSSKWDPKNNGIPQGDWCAATNSPATADCHDAWQNLSYAAFQGFNIKDDTCPAM